LPARAQALADAGLTRVTVSLDALDDETFGAMNDVAFPVARVLAAIDAAAEAGMAPGKINMVVRRGGNGQCGPAMANAFRSWGPILRLTEFMDVGTTKGWVPEEVLPAEEIRRRIDAVWPLRALKPGYPGEVASRFAYVDGAGEIGLIASVTEPF